MDEKNDLIKVGKYDLRYNELLSIDIEELDIFRSKGLPAHMVKRKHFNCLKYIDYLPEIIENPDYVGVNPNENDKSIEFIKKYSKNVLVGVKLEKNGQYLYVSSMYDIQDSKISKQHTLIISIVIFEVGNGSRRTLKRVPEMMDTPPIQK